VGLLKEGDEIASDFKGSPAINAALISAAQKVEHHEMASYGALRAWAGLLGKKEAADLLLEILGEEKAANDALSALARASINKEALGESDEKRLEDAPDSGLRNPRRGIRPVGIGRNRGDSVLH
jgi:ferritin-like metal-binding protein YciE